MNKNHKSEKNQNTNATMNPATIENLKPYYEDEFSICVEAKQIKDNKSLFSNQFFSQMYLKGDKREVHSCIVFGDKAIPVTTMHKLMHSSIDALDNNIYRWCKRPEYINEQAGQYIHEQQVYMVRGHLIISELRESYVNNPFPIRSVYNKTNRLMSNIIKNERLFNSLSKEAVDMESSFDKNAGSIQLIDTEINNEYMLKLLNHACYGLTTKVKKLIEQQLVHYDAYEEYHLLLVGLIMTSCLMGYDKKHTVKYILDSTKFFSRELVKSYYDIMTL